MTALVETMAYAGEVPWHGLGVPVSNDLSVDEMLVAAGLDWEVRKVPTFFEIETTKQIGNVRMISGAKERHRTGQYALIRDTDYSVLTHVSKTWEPCQNHEAFSIFEEFVEANSLEMHTAGSLKNGQLVWALARMKQGFVLFDDDVTEQYLLLVNPHKFGHSIHIRNTPIRVVCNNTLTLAMNTKGENFISANKSHRTSFDPEAMKEAIGIATSQLNKYKEVASFIASRQFNEATIQNYFDEVFPNMSVKRGKEHSRNSVIAMEALETQPGAEYGAGTWWNAFNTVTFMADHVHGKSNESRMNSAWFGANADRKVKALNLAIKYAKAA
jgi:phage/plasmid-like protein (TIGR03299 family)